MSDELLEQVRLATEAIEAIADLRERLKGTMFPSAERDSTLAKAEYRVRGVRDELTGQLGTEEVADVIADFEEADDG